VEHLKGLPFTWKYLTRFRTVANDILFFAGENKEKWLNNANQGLKFSSRFFEEKLERKKNISK
jgi:hypothetical protein